MTVTENTITIDDLMLIFNCGTENAEILNTMLATAKKEYVQKHHTYAITHIEKGSKAGKWKTYVGNPRKEIVRNTEKALYDTLYNYYNEHEKNHYTFRDAAEAWLTHKRENQNRSSKTIIDYRNVLKRFLPESFWTKKLKEISEDDIEKLFAIRAKEVCPTKDALKKTLQYVKAIFDFSVKRKWCPKNPALTVELTDLYSLCKFNKKMDNEKAFSKEELELIKKDALQHIDNPRALIELMAAETGMRCGELCSLRWEDVETDFIHIHRQQIIDNSVKGQRKIYEVPYTKDERMQPHDGRRFPRTLEIDKILEIAKNLPGDSIYVFHDGNDWVLKDGYGHYLSKRCRALGITTTHNHAFRMALNSRLIAEGYMPADRALLLGHSVETNERHYSLADSRSLSEIRLRMLAKEK